MADIEIIEANAAGDVEAGNVEIVDAQVAGPHGALCGACGSPYDAHDRFCPACGTPVADAQPAAPEQPSLQRHFRCQNCGSEVAIGPELPDGRSRMSTSNRRPSPVGAVIALIARCDSRA